TRTAIVYDLVAGKVSAPVAGLLSFAAQNGPAGDYADDVSALAAAAAGRRDARVAGYEGPLGRLSALERADGYATAVLGTVPAGPSLGNIEEDLFRFMRVVEGNEPLAEALTASELPGQVRQRLVWDLLSSKVSPESVRLAAYPARICRPRDYLTTLAALVQRVAAESHRRVAEVSAAVELDACQRERLAAVLRRLAGYDVEVRVTQNPELLGGFVATVGGTVVDGSLRRRLQRAKELLFAPPVAQPGAKGPGEAGVQVRSERTFN
ncbi:MAG: F0F1 ATP synthase subunit delta, partial [Acidimicrobiales bacterium]